MMIRPRLQRAFYAWMTEAQYRFAIPLYVTRRSDDIVIMKLLSLQPYLTRHEISIPVSYQDCDWDLLYCNDDIDPEEVAGGYVCRNCKPEFKKLYPTREALWRDHLFEPFLRWVNTKLAKSEAIGLGGQMNAVTWAELLPSDNGPFTHVIPLEYERRQINADVLQMLLHTSPDEPMKVPNNALTRWIDLIPDLAVRSQANIALAKRIGVEPVEIADGPVASDEQHLAWLAEGFDPPMYSTNDQTGKELRMARSFLDSCGLLTNKIEPYYSMPHDLDRNEMSRWLRGDVSKEEREAATTWRDNDGNEYCKIGDRFIRKP